MWNVWLAGWLAARVRCVVTAETLGRGGTSRVEIMPFDIYCDESHPELFSSRRPTAKYMTIGSLWTRAEDREEIKRRVKALRQKHGVRGEFKWSKISPSSLQFHLEIVDLFFELKLRFRVIVIDAGKVDLEAYHNGDPELGFYKFYYQLFRNWILPGSTYTVFCDGLITKQRGRLQDLKNVLTKACPAAEILAIESVDSSQSDLTQVCDILNGAVQMTFNQSNSGSSAKLEVAKRIERHLGSGIKRTWATEPKFNVFEIDLGRLS